MAWALLTFSISGYAESLDSDIAPPATAAAGTFWIPFQASPLAGTTGGKSGLFLVPSNGLNTALAPQFVNSRPSSLYVASGTRAIDYGSADEVDTLGTVIYAGAGNDGKVHLYGLNLGDSSAVPVERQVGSLSVAAATDLCVIGQVQTDMTDAATLFVVIDIAGSQGCGGGSDRFVVVHFADSPSTAPTNFADDPNQSPETITPIYLANGKFAGSLYLDHAGKSLNFSANDGFTHPTTIADATGYGAAYPAGNMQSVVVAVYHEDGTGTIYKVASTGKTTLLHATNTAVPVIADAQNAYFVQVVSQPEYSTAIEQVSLSGSGKTVELCKVGGSNGDGYSSGIGGLFFSSGTAVYYSQGSFDLETRVETSFVYATRVGQTDGCPSVALWSLISGPYPYTSYSSNLFFASPTRDPEAARLLSTEYREPLVGPLKEPGLFSDGVISLSGVQLSSVKNSIYLYGGWDQLNDFVDLVSPSAFTLRLNDLGASASDYGGAEFASVDMATLAAVPLKTSTGSVYKVPTGYTAVASPVVNGPIGTLTLTSTSNAFSAAVDLSAATILPIEFPNTNVMPLR